jgi:hypothetical protein
VTGGASKGDTKHTTIRYQLLAVTHVLASLLHLLLSPHTLPPIPKTPHTTPPPPRHPLTRQRRSTMRPSLSLQGAVAS